MRYWLHPEAREELREAAEFYRERAGRRSASRQREGRTMTKSAFHELGLANADKLVVKSRLMRFLAEEVRKRGLTRKTAGKLLGLDQSNVSALMNETISRFSTERLMALAARLGFAVTIHIEDGGVTLDVPVCTAA